VNPDGSETIAVVGGGQMGLGIAHAFAVAGYGVTLVDLDATALTRATQAIAAILDQGVARGRLVEADAKAALARIGTTSELGEALAGAALVVETATERFDVKAEILRSADAELPGNVVIATNTSALSITELAAVTKRPDRVVGMHFFNPVHKMKLIEIVRGLETADATVELIAGYAECLGKQRIVVNEAPGFTTSRVSVLLGNEAMYMLMEGVASAEDIDTALRLGLNHPMGPLELGDLTGWDTRLSVLQHLHRTLGEKYRPCPLILKMVKAGRLGRKAGRGVYDYVDGERVAGSGLEGR
jgi:3-hydroxybutyryl-CoA dehydrogenase